MRFKRFFTKADAFAHHVGAHQPRDRGVDVNNRTAGEIKRAVRSQQTAAPYHVRNRHIRERHPYHNEYQYRRETNTFRQRTDDQANGNTGKGALESNVDVLIEAPHQRFQFNIFQQYPVEVADEAAASAEGQRVAINHPQYADQRKRHDDLRQHGENVFTADQPAVEQRDARNRHKQHQRGANHHKSVVGFVRDRRCGHRQPRKESQRSQTCFHCCYLHCFVPHHCVV